MDGKLVIVSAPSGAGKTTLIKDLLDRGVNLEFSISATTRKPRGNEVDGREYYFLSPADFNDKLENDQFVEWEEVYTDHRYGTLKSELERIWTKGNHVLFDVDVKGAMNLKSIFGKRAISIFIKPPSVSELEKRLFARATDDVEKIQMRVNKAQEELKLAEQFDYIVVNDNLEEAKRGLYSIVMAFLGDKKV